MDNNERYYVSVSEAAKMLAVTRETVRSYVKRGVLDGRSTPISCVVLIDSIKQFAEMDKTSLEQRMQAVKQMEEELDARKKQLEQSIKKVEEYEREREEKFEKSDVLYNVMKRRFVLSEFIGACISIMEDKNGNRREAEAVRLVLAGYSYDQVAKSFKLTYERARVLFYKGMRRLGKIDDYRAMREENDRLNLLLQERENELKVMTNEIDRLKEFIRTHEKMEGDIKETLGNDYDLEKMGQMVNAGMLCKSFNDKALSLSTRAINILNYLDIETIYDLVRLTEKQILRVRNAGKKTLVEIQDALDAYGLKLGMSHSEIHNWLLAEKRQAASDELRATSYE